jgi:ADP-heptose:LPS heptosyltransferase
VARPGSEGAPDIEWVPHYKGGRGYHIGQTPTHWLFNPAWKAKPGEFFFSQGEIRRAEQVPHGFVLIEPNVPHWKSVAVNKQWPVERWQATADELRRLGYRVVQLRFDKQRHVLRGVEYQESTSFRHAASILARATLFIGHEGGMHHAAAALGVPGVVIFGGFIPPSLTGYDKHRHLTGGPTTACGSLYACPHCAQQLNAIHVSEVTQHALALLQAEPTAEVT